MKNRLGLDDGQIARAGQKAPRRPRLGFVGLGQIGLKRLEAIVADGAAEVVALCDPTGAALEQAWKRVPTAQLVGGLDDLWGLDLDGVVIATPNALHAEQSVAALDRGLAVFCQKPLGRNAAEARRVVQAAREADRRLCVDLSYRHTRALEEIRAAVCSGQIGRVYAAELTFHTARGPGSAWYRDRSQSGGGCLMDLGIHLIDAGLWVLGFPEVEEVRGTRWSSGFPLDEDDLQNEDYAVAEIRLAQGSLLRVTCSWWQPMGREVEISADFWGNGGGLRFRNLDGSEQDFVAEACRGRTAEPLVSPPDAWGGRAAVRWARALITDRSFDPEVAQQIRVAEVIDAAYRSPSRKSQSLGTPLRREETGSWFSGSEVTTSW
jgi:predicted dehydrogenase